MKRPILFLICLSAAGQNNPVEPEPPYVDPGPPPRDAIVLFNGTDASGWTDAAGNPVTWQVRDGALLNRGRTRRNHIYSKHKHADAQIHVEFNVPSMPEQKGQARGNSGVYLQGRYEIQVLDSYQNPTYVKGMCGALYGQSAPFVNACRPPEQWQSYDIIFHPPKCDAEGNYAAPGRVTVLLNGVLILDNAKVTGRAKCDPQPGPIMLQDHYHRDAEETPMRFRNIWVRPIPAAE
jgi:hypothetical protein